jgi:uncharacterized protein (TIGR03382 family)
MRQGRLPLLLGLSLSVGCGAYEENAAVETAASQAHKPIINGAACSETEFESAVAVMVDATLTLGSFTQPMKSVFCTGTLIAPDVVLTAAHCLDASALSGGIGTVSDAVFYVASAADLTALASGSSMDFPAGSIAVADFVANPAFSLNAFNTTVNGPGEYHDVGLMFLSAPMTPRPARVATVEQAQGWLTQNQEIEIVGWGLQQQGSSNPLQPPPAGTVGRKMCALSFVNDVGVAEFQVGGGANTARKCHGDSGGPSYVLTDGDLPTVVGITSHAYDQSDCAKGGVDTRVDTWREWVDGEMTQRCTAGTRVWCGVPGVPPGDYVFPTVVVNADGGTEVVDAGPTPDAATSGGGSGGDAPSSPKQGCNSQTAPGGMAWGLGVLLVLARVLRRR